MMTAEQEKILHDTHAKVSEIIGILSGGNGGGLVKRVCEQGVKLDKIEEIIPRLVTQRDCSDTRKEKKGDKKDLISRVIATISVIVAIGALLLSWIKP